MGLAGYYPLPDAYRVVFGYTGWYVLGCGVLALWWSAAITARLISLTRLPTEDATQRLRRMARFMLPCLPVMLLIYSTVGVLTVDASLAALGIHAPYSAAKRTSHLVGAAIPALATALPLFFYINATLDRYFAPRRIIPVVTSMHVKLFVSCLIAPLLIDIVLLAYFTNREGAVDPRALWIWAVLLVFAATSFLMGRSDLTRALSPLQGLTAGRLELTRARDLLQPVSLDELGVVIARLLRQIEQEELLRGDVDRLNERLIQAAYATGLGVFDHDLRSKALYWTADMYRILGAPAGEPARVSLYIDAIHPEDRKRADIAFAQACDPAGDRRYDIEHRIVRRDGTMCWISIHAQTFFADEGGSCRPVRVVGAMIDITARVATEARRRALEAELQQARRLEAMGTFASGIAHDFNNILAIINGNLEGARAVLPRDHAGLQYLNLIALAAQRGVDLTTQISLFARGQRQVMRPVPIGPEVEEAVRLVSSTVPANAAIAVDIRDRDLEVLSGPGQLQQVVSNLVTNAVHALGSHAGSVSVVLRGVRLPDAAQQSPQSCQAGPYAVISVADTGSGMTPETLDRIFEPFFTTRLSGYGTGLGLAVVDRIVRAIGGAIGVRSAPGQGSVFEVWLPAEHRTRRLHEGAATGAPPLVLVVDDDPLVLATIAMQIRRAGFPVAGAADGAAAMREYAQARPGIAVVDFRLPDISGVELIRWLRQGTNLPCVLLTGENDPLIAAQARQAGATSILCKPVDTVQMLKVLNSILPIGGATPAPLP